MKTQYTNQELTEILTSDADVEQLRSKILHTCTNKIIIYSTLLISILIWTFIIGGYGLSIQNDLLQVLSIVMLLPIYGTFERINKYCTIKENIIQATTSLSTAKKCVDFANLVDEYPEARQLSQKAQAQGRQLYNFDMKYINYIIRQQLAAVWDQVRNERELREKQEEEEACKKIHGLPV